MMSHRPKPIEQTMSSTNSTSKSNVFEPASYETLKEQADIANEAATKRKELDDVRNKLVDEQKIEKDATYQIVRANEHIINARAAFEKKLETNNKKIRNNDEKANTAASNMKKLRLEETELMQWFEQHRSD